MTHSSPSPLADSHGIASPLPPLLDLWQSTVNWCPSDTQLTQFQQVYACVLEANQHLNLTRITEPLEFWEKHLWDSLRGLKPWLGADLGSETSALDPSDTPQGRSPLQFIDIGTGGGFPGIPGAIALPHSQGVLLDSTQKKIAFLQTLLQTLSLPSLTPLVNRAETLGQDLQHRERYDLALLRAVAPATVCAEYALPLLKLNGTAVLYRGQWSEAETQALTRACQQLGGVVEEIDAFSTPLSQGLRHCVYLRKRRPTPEAFPRAVGVPAKHPLGNPP